MKNLTETLAKNQTVCSPVCMRSINNKMNKTQNKVEIHTKTKKITISLKNHYVIL